MLAACSVCILAVVALVAAERSKNRTGIAIAKMSAASAFIALALAGGAFDSSYGEILLAGLTLCWIGDACLLSKGQSTGFLAGIAAFLLAHLAYAIAFSRLGLDPIGLAAGGLVMVGFAVVVLRWLWPRVPRDFRIPVASYVGVISIMVVASIAAVADGAPFLLAVGAIGFAISDLFVARERFVESAYANSAIGLPAYFGSQLVLAYSVSLGLGA
jgi:uncharacterized membrane protein YhhN